MKSVIINEKDNVGVCLDESEQIPAGHKYALCDIPKGEYVIKYGEIIGRATQDIKPGEWVHTHNVKSHLDENVAYRYEFNALNPTKSKATFLGYKREKGRAGIRNEIYIITTLEEKSLGCIEKAGSTEIVDVLAYGELVKEQGVSVLNAPGNDLIAATALAASGCQIVLFTTGRGTPFSTFVPTMKIGTNNSISALKNGWIDFNAYGMDKDGLFNLLQKTINGDYKCKSEDVREIAFYKTGVTL